MIDAGTNGGRGGANGARRRRRRIVLLLSGFAVIFVMQFFANVLSRISDVTDQGIAIPASRVWIWEATSFVAWITTLPAIWWLVRTVRPPRFGWGVTIAVLAVASVPVSLWHIALMAGLRQIIYLALDDRYRFFAERAGARVLYEYRKDVPTYLVFAGFAAVAQWLLRREEPVAATASVLTISDGSIVHHVPHDEIDWAVAAGNYVEIAWRGRTLLHRATLGSVESDLGSGFVRIHRGRIVRRGAIRRIETDRSGDFVVLLDGDIMLRGSRRYRDAL